MSEFNPFSLSGKKILVTGASSGIGRGIAIACAKMGAQIVIQGRNEQRMKETLSQMPQNDHLLLAGDLTVHDDIVRIVSQLPPLDGIVHCAGIGLRKLCKMIEQEDVDSVVGINFKAPVMLQAQILQEKKINKGGSIVFISSLASESESVGNALYSASKGAIISYAKCLSLEVAPRLIRVNCVQPAMVWTDLVFDSGLTKEELEEDEKKYPLKRYGTPDDVANLAIYLLSDASLWMTGSSIKITGGGC